MYLSALPGHKTWTVKIARIVLPPSFRSNVYHNHPVIHSMVLAVMDEFNRILFTPAILSGKRTIIFRRSETTAWTWVRTKFAIGTFSLPHHRLPTAWIVQDGH